MTVYATRLVNGTDSMERMRHTDSLGLFAAGPGAARGGLRFDGGGEVTVNAGTMTVDVSAFMAYVDGGVSDAQGGYTFVSDGAETLTVSPGHASLSRTDVVIAEVRDTVHDGSGSTDARVRILEGTPGSGVPALPTNALALRELNIPAGLSAGTGGLASGNLGSDRRTYTAALGGILPVGSEAERDALTVNGTVVYRTDVDTVEVKRASGWEVLTSSLDAIPVTGNTATGIAMGPNVVNTGDGTRAWRRNGVVTLEIYAAQSAGTSGSTLLSVPADWAPPYGVRFSVNLSSNTTERAAYLNDAGTINIEGGLASTQSVYGSVTYVT